MYKLEIICESCNSHFVVVTQEETNPSFCPFCSNPYTDREDLDIMDDSE